MFDGVFREDDYEPRMDAAPVPLAFPWQLVVLTAALTIVAVFAAILFPDAMGEVGLRF